MTLRCLICWQTIRPTERHVVLDAGHGDGEHIACASGWLRREFAAESLAGADA